MLTAEEKKKEEKEPTVWKSCCLYTNKDAVLYLGQISVTVMVLIFSFYSIIYSDGECNTTAPYFSLISFLLGKLLSNAIS